MVVANDPEDINEFRSWSSQSLKIDNLKAQLAEVANGKRFLLQGGDCAELFEYCAEVNGLKRDIEEVQLQWLTFNITSSVLDWTSSSCYLLATHHEQDKGSVANVINSHLGRKDICGAHC